MKRYCLAVFFIWTSLTAVSQTDKARVLHFNLRKNVGLEGYDPVSYFSNKPEEGSDKFTTTYKSVRYRFASSANQQKFIANPEKFEPAYGGWCAYAMGATGEKVKVDPETYKIVDGKLYLFYNFWANNTLEDWNESETKLKKAADLNWSKIVK